MKKKRTCFGKTGLLLGFLAIMSGELKAAAFFANNVPVYISPGTGLTLSGDLTISGNAPFTNKGTIYLENGLTATVRLPASDLGDGAFSFTGSADVDLRGGNARLGDLTVDLGDHTLWLDGNLTVNGQLALSSGIVNTNDNSRLIVQNSSPGAIKYSAGASNESFVEGILARNVQGSDPFVFPVGSAENGFHPFFAANASGNALLEVRYDPGFSSDWAAWGITSGVVLENIGGWKVMTENNAGITFSPGLSLYGNNQNILSVPYNILYAKDPDLVNLTFSLDYNSKTEGSFLTTSTRYGTGAFALNVIPTTSPGGGEGEAIPKLVNFLVQGGNARTTFEIPGIANYRQVVLTVYNRWGIVVYKNDNYANNFDAMNFPTGTYYYELTLVTSGGKKLLKRSIIEIMRKS